MCDFQEVFVEEGCTTLFSPFSFPDAWRWVRMPTSGGAVLNLGRECACLRMEKQQDPIKESWSWMSLRICLTSLQRGTGHKRISFVRKKKQRKEEKETHTYWNTHAPILLFLLLFFSNLNNSLSTKNSFWKTNLTISFFPFNPPVILVCLWNEVPTI